MQRVLSSTVSMGVVVGLYPPQRWGRNLSSITAAQASTAGVRVPTSVLPPASFVIATSQQPRAVLEQRNLFSIQQEEKNACCEPWDSSVALPDDMNLHDTERWKCAVYQFESCPFCRKVRACLDYFRIPYQVAEVHPLSKKELKGITEYSKVPVLAITDMQNPGAKPLILKDSKTIVHALYKHEHGSSLNNTDKEVLEAEAAWVQWTDDVLVQLIVMNIYRSLKESAETFAYLLTHPQFSFFERRSAQILGTFVMWLVSKRKKNKYQVIDERASLYAALNAFLEAKGAAPFHGGPKPNQVDISVYGILRSIESFTCEKDIFMHTRIKEWMNAMDQVICSSTKKRNFKNCS